MYCTLNCNLYSWCYIVNFSLSMNILYQCNSKGEIVRAIIYKIINSVIFLLMKHLYININKFIYYYILYIYEQNTTPM